MILMKKINIKRKSFVFAFQLKWYNKHKSYLYLLGLLDFGNYSDACREAAVSKFQERKAKKLVSPVHNLWHLISPTKTVGFLCHRDWFSERWTALTVPGLPWGMGVMNVAGCHAGNGVVGGWWAGRQVQGPPPTHCQVVVVMLVTVMWRGDCVASWCSQHFVTFV